MYKVSPKQTVSDTYIKCLYKVKYLLKEISVTIQLDNSNRVITT